MARISTPDTLEVGTIVGTRFERLFLRVFEKFENEAELFTSHVSYWDGEDFRLLRTFDREIVDIAFAPDGALLALDSRGALFALAESEWSQLCGPVDPPQRVSVLRVLGERIFALGERGAFFERQGADWRIVDLGLGRRGLRDLMARGDGGVVVCGTRGTFGHVSASGDVEIVDLGTNANLLSLFADGDDILVCGAKSTLLRVSGSEAAIIADEGGPRTLSRFAAWDGLTLVTAANAILSLDGDTLAEFAPLPSFRLTATHDALFNHSVDAVQVLRDGTWEDFPVWLDIPDRPDAATRTR